METFHIGKDTVVENMILDDIAVENRTDGAMPFLVNKGVVKSFTMPNIRGIEGEIIDNTGILPENICFENIEGGTNDET